MTATEAMEPKATVLVVDDSPANLHLIKVMLADPLYDVVTATSGCEALKRIAAESYLAAVVLDVKMAGMDGFETASAIRQQETTHELPIIFLTAHVHNQGDIAQGYSLGAVDYLIKPPDQAILRAKIKFFVELFYTRRELVKEIEHRRRAEASVRELNAALGRYAEELLEANRELDSFAHTISHDLRAPLRYINGFVEMLARELGTESTAKALDCMAKIRTATLMADQLVVDLLAFAHLGRKEVDCADVSLSQMVEEARQALVPETAGRNVEWHIGTLPTVPGDATLLRQVFINLLGNALKYSRGRDPAIIEVRSQESPTETTISIQDNGVGFNMQYADKLFGVFERLHSSDDFEGSGIGLATVRRIITRHGGRVWAESVVNKGATFHFTIPR
jgi:signal transduction histidine kinase